MRKKIKKAIPVRYHDGLSQLRPNAGGIDIGASEVWVDVGNKDAEPTRMFETFTADLNRMGDWLKSCGIGRRFLLSIGIFGGIGMAGLILFVGISALFDEKTQPVIIRSLSAFFVLAFVIPAWKFAVSRVSAPPANNGKKTEDLVESLMKDVQALS